MDYSILLFIFIGLFIVLSFSRLAEVYDRYKNYPKILDNLLDLQNVYNDNKKLKDENLMLKNSNYAFVEKIDSIKKEKTEQFRSKDNVIQKLQIYNTKLNNDKELLETLAYDDFVSQDVKYNEILKLIKQGKNLFITGGAGVGKSYILNKLKKEFAGDLALTAFTGVAAVNIGGMTIHSFCGIGTGKMPAQVIINSILNDDKKKILKNELKKVKMIAIDEISMLNMFLFEYINEVLQGVRHSRELFGGVQIIAIGDFFQLPPVIKKGIECEYAHLCRCSKTQKEQDKCIKRSFVFNSQLFNDFKIVNLTEIKRQDDKFFANVLNRIRFGRNVQSFTKVFRDNFVPKNYDGNEIFLYSTNKDCDKRNSIKFDKLSTKAQKFYAHDDFIPKEKSVTSPKIKEICEKLNENTRALEKLVLKVGARVMLVHNLNVNAGLCNGAIGTVLNMDFDKIEVQFDKCGRHTITRVDIELQEPDGVYVRNQIPLVLAYAITIHKSQGLSLDNACISMNEIFSDGQAYVALSRLKSINGLKLINGYNSGKIMTNAEVLKYYACHGVLQ